MSGAEDNPATRRESEPSSVDDRIFDELLRQIGADILDEPVPERLRRALRPTGGRDDGTTADGRTRGRDDESSG
jgi:hypothetical protein